MTQKSALAQTRSQLYRAARDLGNIQAASKGPSAYSKRLVRRAVLRNGAKMSNHLLRQLGI